MYYFTDTIIIILTFAGVFCNLCIVLMLIFFAHRIPSVAVAAKYLQGLFL